MEDLMPCPLGRSFFSQLHTDAYHLAQGMLRGGRALLSSEKSSHGWSKGWAWKALEVCFCMKPCVRGLADWDGVGLRSVQGWWVSGEH